MNKSELVSVVAERAGLSKKDTEAAVNTFMEVVKEVLANKDSVELVGFGSFKTSDRAARKGRNPQTGAEIDIPATTVPKFVAGKAMKDAVK